MSEAIPNLVKVLDGRRITLPKNFCQRNKIEKGSHLQVKDDGTQLMLVPIEIMGKTNP